MADADIVLYMSVASSLFLCVLFPAARQGEHSVNPQICSEFKLTNDGEMQNPTSDVWVLFLMFSLLVIFPALKRPVFILKMF